MNTTWFEKGIETGIEKGMEKGRREALCEQLEDRFGPLSIELKKKIQQLPPARLTVLTRAVLHAASLRELGLED